MVMGLDAPAVPPMMMVFHCFATDSTSSRFEGSTAGAAAVDLNCGMDDNEMKALVCNRHVEAAD